MLLEKKQSLLNIGNIITKLTVDMIAMAELIISLGLRSPVRRHILIQITYNNNNIHLEHVTE